MAKTSQSDKTESTSMYQESDLIRVIDSKKDKYRSEWERDLSRLKHSAAFRRLSGKTQLLPGRDSDFFRNRLTHSIEVAQIAKTIAHKININQGFYSTNDLNTGIGIPKNPLAISLSIVEFAGLAHDIGHPPFGHVGERALDQIMRECGGFEGNAQTLRILAKLEKKHWDHHIDFGIFEYPRTHKHFGKKEDQRVGLNLTYRSLASILKYDCAIPDLKDRRTQPKYEKYYKPSSGLLKGYYETEEDLVNRIKTNVLGSDNFNLILKGKEFKTIECQIMDIADDIAYSTYDLEDSIKAGFINLFDLYFLHDEKSWVEEIANKVTKGDVNKLKKHMNELLPKVLMSEEDFPDLSMTERIEGSYQTAKEYVVNGFKRGEFTSSLVEFFMNGIEYIPDEKHPSLSIVKLNDEIAEKMEIIKRFTHMSLVESSRIQMVEYRARDIIEEIFYIMLDKNGVLLPKDSKHIYDWCSSNPMRKRVICDFIAGMTDKFALEFYARITGASPDTIFKPTH